MHPLAWWAWAAGIAVAISRVGNPLVLMLLTAAVVIVAYRRRQVSQWSRTLEMSLILGLVVILVRTGFYVLVGLPDSTPVLADLPGFALPAWFTNLTLLGPVHFGGLMMALIEGLRLAALIIVFGAAGALANPRRALRHLPSSLHHLGTAAVIAVSAAPQLITSATRVRRAQQLRGGAQPSGRLGRLRGWTAVLLPVLAGALDQALALAGSMDSRGYARADRRDSSGAPTGSRVVGAGLVVALFAAAGGTYGLLDSATPTGLSVGLLAGGLTLAVAASWLASASVRRTRYRPGRWSWADSAVAASGFGVGAVALVGTGVLADPTLGAWRASAPWPQLSGPGAAMVVLALAALLAAAAPVPTKVHPS